MLIDRLREKHSAFVYRGFEISSEQDHLVIKFDFLLEPDIQFKPIIGIPVSEDLDPQAIRTLVFNLGLVEMISYWKTACPKTIRIEAGPLSQEQISWWHDLFIHGLGEFYFHNSIDFTQSDFLEIQALEPNQADKEHLLLPDLAGDLIMVGGGKDSTLTLELLGSLDKKKAGFMLNPRRASLESARIAGYRGPVIAKRTIDPMLLKLNAQGYLNGHTPFSAYLAFLSLITAAANGFNQIIASNEWSSNQPNTEYRGLPINHQYSKSLRFEHMFREYCEHWLTPDIHYFSFLRPLLDLQISRLFSSYAEQLFSFRSCNVHLQQDSWCRKCPKCAFVYLCLSPFVDKAHLSQVFSKDLFCEPEIQTHLRMLLGLEQTKPFECVGTIEESRAALFLSIKKMEQENIVPPTFLISMLEQVKAAGFDEEEVEGLLEYWNDNHFLPPEYELLLKQAIEREADVS